MPSYNYKTHKFELILLLDSGFLTNILTNKLLKPNPKSTTACIFQLKY